MKILSIAAVAAVLAAAVAFAGVGRPGAAHSSATPAGRTITVNGTGTARGAPDTALFTFGVETQGATAKAALTASSAKMRGIIAALRREGIARADLRTQDISVYPRRSDSGVLEGFSASGSVSATVHRLSKAGAVVDAAVSAGADETSGPQFDRTSRAGLTKLALRDAFADARAKAETLAEQAGAQLGDVRRSDEQGSPPQPQPYFDAVALRAARTPVEPGTQNVQASVTVTFSLS
jgi:uncharacterized protein